MTGYFRASLAAAALLALPSKGLQAQQPTIATTDAQPSIRDLDRLVGKWTFYDEATPLAGFDYREEGTIECRYAVDDAYIRCDGVGHRNGKTRSFVEYINYNFITEQFERVGIFGNHPAKAVFAMTLSDDGKMIKQKGTPMQQRGGYFTRNWGKIRFVNDDHYIWETRVNRSDEDPDHWPLKFISEYKRVKLE